MPHVASPQYYLAAYGTSKTCSSAASTARRYLPRHSRLPSPCSLFQRSKQALCDVAIACVRKILLTTVPIHYVHSSCSKDLGGHSSLDNLSPGSTVLPPFPAPWRGPHLTYFTVCSSDTCSSGFALHETPLLAELPMDDSVLIVRIWTHYGHGLSRATAPTWFLNDAVGAALPAQRIHTGIPHRACRCATTRSAVRRCATDACTLDLRRERVHRAGIRSRTAFWPLR